MSKASVCRDTKMLRLYHTLLPSFSDMLVSLFSAVVWIDRGLWFMKDGGDRERERVSCNYETLFPQMQN